MYRALLLAGAVGLTLITPAMAQSDQDRDREQQSSQGERREHNWRQMRGGMERMFPALARALSNGTFFRVRIGDNEIDLHCPPSLALGACVTNALELAKGLSSTSNQTQ